MSTAESCSAKFGVNLFVETSFIIFRIRMLKKLDEKPIVLNFPFFSTIRSLGIMSKRFTPPN